MWMRTALRMCLRMDWYSYLRTCLRTDWYSRLRMCLRRLRTCRSRPRSSLRRGISARAV